MTQKDSAERAVRDIRRKTRRKFSAEEKIRIVLEGLLARFRWTSIDDR
jgi:transposase